MNNSISILCPTRGRPELFSRMENSALDNAEGSVQIFAYVDDDDSKLSAYQSNAVSDIVVGPSEGVGKAWNMLVKKATGDLLMMGNDDLVFHTEGWDKKIIEVIESMGFKDNIFVAWANDGAPNSEVRCTFPIVSKEWVEAVGYFVPECFNFLWHDTWVHAVGKEVGRLIYIPDVLIEHKHFAFKKSAYDDTYKRHRIGKENKLKRKQDQEMFAETAHIRELEAEKLKACMEVA
jgi:hypothetical protein